MKSFMSKQIVASFILWSSSKVKIIKESGIFGYGLQAEYSVLSNFGKCLFTNLLKQIPLIQIYYKRRKNEAKKYNQYFFVYFGEKFSSRIKIRIFRKTTQRQKITSGPVLLRLRL